MNQSHSLTSLGSWFLLYCFNLERNTYITDVCGLRIEFIHIWGTFYLLSHLPSPIHFFFKKQKEMKRENMWVRRIPKTRKHKFPSTLFFGGVCYCVWCDCILTAQILHYNMKLYWWNVLSRIYFKIIINK